MGSIPGWRTKISQALQCGQREKKKKKSQQGSKMYSEQNYNKYSNSARQDSTLVFSWLLWEVVVSWTPYNIDPSAFRCVHYKGERKALKDKHTDRTKLSASMEAAVITCSILSISCPIQTGYLENAGHTHQ